MGKRQGIAFEQSWEDRIVLWDNAWAHDVADVHDLGGPFDEGMYREYLHWFHGATHVHCFLVPVEVASYEAEITNTSTMEPPAAFHALVNKFLNYVVYPYFVKEG